VVTRERNVQRLGDVTGQKLCARAEAARGKDNCSRREHAVFCRRAGYRAARFLLE
jgi:hypothetical protein